MIKAMTKKELAIAYGIHISTLMKWLKEIPELNLTTYQKLLTPKQIQIIFEKLGAPI